MQTLSVSDIEALSHELDDFAILLKSPLFEQSKVEIDEVASANLCALLDSVRDFNLRAKKAMRLLVPVPLALGTTSPIQILGQLRDQLEFQRLVVGAPA
ncbi:MAG: hypothetical protein EXS05_15280 [Planctomycetaceae bacterium]|nr:hypothetical protein [Planctomycetaceae bacterium]